jgi:amidase
VPVAIKDLLYTAGVPTVGGLKVRRDFVPQHNAEVVTRLHEAGAVILGKLNLTEGALSGYHPEFPIPLNPHGDKLWAGVSSSGSGVAVAAGLCYAAIGTDTGGSIRYPCMANGIAGLKPTYGRVSRYGVMELAGSLDHVGPMARSVEDLALVFKVIAGHDPKDPTSLHQPLSDAAETGIEGLKLGVDELWYSGGTDSELVAAIDQMISLLERCGVEVVQVRMPPSTPMELRDLWLPLCGYEAAKAHAATFPSRREDYGPYLAEVMELGLQLSDAEYADIQRKREAFSERFCKELARVDAVICPSGGTVFEVDAAAQYGGMDAMKEVIRNFQGQFTIPADLAGVPGLTLPAGFKTNGWPLCVQLIGPPLGDEKLLRLGTTLERLFPTWLPG